MVQRSRSDENRAPDSAALTKAPQHAFGAKVSRSLSRAGVAEVWNDQAVQCRRWPWMHAIMSGAQAYGSSKCSFGMPLIGVSMQPTSPTSTGCLAATARKQRCQLSFQ